MPLITPGFFRKAPAPASRRPGTGAPRAVNAVAPLPPALARDVSFGILLATVLLMLRAAYLLFLTPYGLGPDEAQYWSWLSHPQWSYLSKPPLTTWLIGLSTEFLGHTMLGVRLFALIAQSAVPVLGMLIALHLVPATAGPVMRRQAGWLAYALVATAPLVAAGGQIMSPDAVLLPLWLTAVLLLVRYALPEDTARLPWAPWLTIGLLIGLAGLAKYTAAFFFPLVALYFLLRRRSALAQPPFYAAILIAALCQLPVLYWNATTGWVGAQHLLWQAGPGDARHGGLGTLLQFLGGQVAVIGVVAFPLLLAAWALTARTLVQRRPLYNGLLLLACLTLPIFAVFLVQTLFAKVQLNWPLLATVPGLVLLAVWLPQALAGQGARVRKTTLGLLVAGMALNAVASVALMDTHTLRRLGVPLSLKADPTKDFMGWPELGRITGGYLAQLDPSAVLLSTRYQTAAELAFHTQVPGTVEFFRGESSRVPVLYLNADGRRPNQYDLWTWPDLTNRLVLYVSDNGNLPAAVSQRFNHCEPYGRAAVVVHDLTVRKASYYLCWQTPPSGPASAQR